ncbi:MAG: glycoside hydrolase, partial [Dysgonamonadaceae bacterium]|nr:glycoside hydrolase [Dysgonamonadaceae bacterium]
MMKKMVLNIFFCVTAFSIVVYADPYAGKREEWLKIEESLKVDLFQRQVVPVRIVVPQEDATAFQGIRMVEKERINGSNPNKKLITGDSIFYDFGEHVVGCVSLSLKTKDGQQIDGPVRLELVFDEVPSGVVVPHSLYQGWISSAWLQSEIITVDRVPFSVDLPRRYTFRYIRINVLNGSGSFELMLNKLEAKSVTLAGKDLGTPTALSPLLNTVDSVSLITLRDCMQTVLEDGPKRDRRLWIGDLRLQALANYVSYNNVDIIKRCLYLLAYCAREDGLLTSTIFEYPEVQPQKNNCSIDYALLYNVILLEYLQQYGDMQTANDLWPVALRQTEIASQYVTNGLFATEDTGGWWRFFDWHEELDKTAAMQGCLIYTFEKTAELAQKLGHEKEAKNLLKQIAAFKKAAMKTYYDKERKVFTAKSGQLSYASQIWMILGGVVKGKEANDLLKRTEANPEMIKPRTPYLYHYYLEALYMCGENEKIKEVIEAYWGGMIHKGADTFWEVYDPENEYLTPYTKG